MCLNNLAYWLQVRCPDHYATKPPLVWIKLKPAGQRPRHWRVKFPIVVHEACSTHFFAIYLLTVVVFVFSICNIILL